jgi:DNA polymerase-4
MDCFYAAIERRDDPHLANTAVTVGGQPHSRGVIATCNYMAKAMVLNLRCPRSR